jgi:hypothetical protein
MYRCMHAIRDSTRLDLIRLDPTRLDSIYDRHMPVVVTSLHPQTDHRRSIADHVASLI